MVISVLLFVIFKVNQQVTRKIVMEKVAGPWEIVVGGGSFVIEGM